MSKQTAVEWLFNQLPDELRLTKSGFDILQQALAMEREQIVEAFQTDWSAYNCSGNKYYERTYGKEASNEG